MPDIDLAAISAELASLRETVRRLSDREEIFDCLHRYNRGLDRLDPDCVMSAYFSDADDHHGPFRGSPEEFTAWVMEHMLQWDASLHILDLNNLTIEGDSADSECYVIFTQRLADHSQLDFGGCRYLDHLERRDGEWRITQRTLVVDWTARAEVTDLPDTPAHPNGRRDKDDRSYSRPFQVQAAV
jgi:hypothetical protein